MLKLFLGLISVLSLAACGNGENSADSNTISGTGLVRYFEATTYRSEGYRLIPDDTDDEYFLTGNLAAIENRIDEDPTLTAEVHFEGTTSSELISSTTAKNGVLEIRSIEVGDFLIQ